VRALLAIVGVFLLLALVAALAMFLLIPRTMM